MDKETAEFLHYEEINPSTDDPEFNHVTQQFTLAGEWLKSIKKCNCELDETSDDCKHIRKALKKLYGHRIDKMWNKSLKEKIESINKVYSFKLPFALQKNLSA